MTQYWIAVAPQQLIEKEVEGGYIQLGHGSGSELNSFARGDWVAYYAPRYGTVQPEFMQDFTALGKVVGDAPFQAQINENYAPWRREVVWKKGTQHASVRPLLGELEATKRLGRRWGLAFRKSLLPISQHDFDLISAAMGADLARVLGPGV